MRTTCGSLALLAVVLMVTPAPARAAQAVRLLASDDRGVTLRLDAPRYRLAGGVDGRSQVIAAGFQAIDAPGRPAIPFATALVALPPGATAVATLVGADGEEERAGVRLAITGQPVSHGDGHGGVEPGREPVPAIVDGAWPVTPVEVGEPFVWRRQRLVAVSLGPFRYDEAGARLWARTGMTVRVDFVGGAAARGGRPAGPGRGEPVLDAAVLNHEQALAWREAARPAQRAGFGATPALGRVAGPARVNAFDEDFPEVRVRIDTTGVYELAYDDLANVGYPAGIKIDQVSVHRHEFVEGAIPSYQTVELAIDVDDADHDTFFGPGDGIIVYVQNWAERAQASIAQRVWGDAECVFVTAVAGTGRRIPSRPGWRDQIGLTPLASYPWRQHWEKDYVYSGFPADTLTDQLHWTGITSFSPPAESLSFETNHLDATRPGSFTLSLTGRSPSSHNEWAQIRNGPGTLFDVMVGVAWLGLGTLNTTVTLPPGTLSEGNVNHLRLWGQGTTSTYDYVGLNSFEATYWRAYRALFDYLPCNSADGSGEIQIHATGFSDPAMQVYDVSDSLNPVRLTIDPAHVQSQGPFEYAVDFQDLVTAGQPHRYVAFRYPKGLPPEVMTRVNRPQTRLSERGAGDYLMIVPEAFLPAVGPLVLKRQEEGLDVVVAPFETVCDEFNGGRKSSYAIKRFTRFAFENWDARWVLLVGDGNLDPLNRTGDSSPDWIPVQRIIGPVGIVNGNEAVPSDPWYGCMGACDISGPSPAVPDLYVGRLPVQTLQQTQDLVRKLVDYDVVSNDQTWRNQLLLSADDEYSDASLQPGGGGPVICRQPLEQVFRGISETVASTVTTDAGLARTEVDRFYLADLLGRIGCTDPQDPNCTCRDLYAVQGATRGQGGPTDQLVNRLNAGCLWWNFQGHANAGQLTHEELVVDDDRGDDTQRLINDGKPFLFSAFSCHANAFARPDDVPFGLGPALGEDLVLRPRGGAIASWASSAFEILPGSSASHVNIALAEAMFSDPPHAATFDGTGARVLLGEAIGLAIARYVPGVAFNQNERGIGLTYQLLGDPATRFSMGPPQAIVTANGDTVINDRPVALAPPRDTLHLEADLASNVRIDAISLESITGTIPPTEYTLTLADTSGGHRYHLSYSTPVRSLRYTIHAQDRYGLKSDFNLVFPFFSQLIVSGNVLAENDPVAPTAPLALRLTLPTPTNDLTGLVKLEVDSTQVTFASTALDTSGREWQLTWTHDPYPPGTYRVEVTASDSLHSVHHFRVPGAAEGKRVLQSVVAFPNPFDEQLGTTFSFYVLSDVAADVMVRVFTVSGRLVYQRQERGLPPGYHQWAWDGRDGDGDNLANGVYLYTLVTTSGGRQDAQDGRLVKLRRPRHNDVTQ